MVDPLSSSPSWASIDDPAGGPIALQGTNGAAAGRRVLINGGSVGPLTGLCIAGEIGIHVDRTVGLDDVPDALAHVGQGRALGKVAAVTP
jgi:hypothetical protein